MQNVNNDKRRNFALDARSVIIDRLTKRRIIEEKQDINVVIQTTKKPKTFRIDFILTSNLKSFIKLKQSIVNLYIVKSHNYK